MPRHHRLWGPPPPPHEDPHGPPPPPHHHFEGAHIPIAMPREFVSTILRGDSDAIRIVERAMEYGPVEIRAGFLLILNALAYQAEEMAQLRACLNDNKVAQSEDE